MYKRQIQIQDFTEAWFADGANGVLEGEPVSQPSEIESIQFDTNIFFLFPRDGGAVNFWASASINQGRFLSLDFDLRPEVVQPREVSLDFMANFNTFVQRTEVTQIEINNPAIVPGVVSSIPDPQPQLGQRFFGNTAFPSLSGAEPALPREQFSGSSFVPVSAKDVCTCEDAVDTADDAARKTDEAIQDEDLQSPTLESKHRATDEAFKGFDLLEEGDEVEDSGLPLKKDGQQTPSNSKPGSPKASPKPSSVKNGESIALVGTATLGFATLGLVATVANKD